MTTNEYRLGGAGGYSLHALGWKNQNSVVYERIELHWDLNGAVRVLDDVSWQNALPTLFDILQAASVDSIKEVNVTENPAGDYYGWKDKNGEIEFIWPSEAQRDMCFPYGPKVEEDKGTGVRVRLSVTQKEPQ